MGAGRSRIGGADLPVDNGVKARTFTHLPVHVHARTSGWLSDARTLTPSRTHTRAWVSACTRIRLYNLLWFGCLVVCALIGFSHLLFDCIIFTADCDFAECQIVGQSMRECRAARGEHEIRSHNVEGSAESVVAAAGRLGRGVVARLLAQAATRRTARGEHEIRSHNVEGSAESVVAAAGRLGRGVVAGLLARVASGHTWSRDEENVLMKGYARMGMCRVCTIQRPRAHTCMYVCTLDGAISTHIDTHEHVQSLTCTCIYTCAHILHVDLLVIYAR